MAKKKLDPKVEAHLHKDLDVTPERVRAFGKATYAERLSVMSKLRAQEDNRASSLELAVAGLLLGLLALFIAPAKGIDLQSIPWWAGLIVGAIYGVAAVIATAPVWIPQAIRHGQQARAHVWLAAYQDEIARRAAKGK